MHLPIVDNFWHGQATVMLTERLPLYILFVYPGFLYVPLACVWRLGLPGALAEITLTGLLTVAFYAPFDVVGAKFLWWTWHDSDTVTLSRIAGVPASSTMWVGVYASMFALMFRVFVPTPASGARPPLLWKPWRVGTMLRALVAACLAIPVMMLLMTTIQCIVGWSLPPPPAPNRTMLGVTLMIYGSLALSAIADGTVSGGGSVVADRSAASGSGGSTTANFSSLRIAAAGSRGSVKHLAGALALYYTALVAIALAGDPTTHVSRGRHQTFGPCGIEVSDYAGDVRHLYICRDTRFQDFKFDGCPAPQSPAELATERAVVADRVMPWYTICGMPKSSEWVRASVGYSLTGAAAFALVLWAGTKRMAGGDGKSD